jgi:DNA-binding NarL/FixJ family response regulator
MPAGSKNGKVSVVLADDHEIVRNGLRLLLEAAGHVKVVGEAEDGRTAVRRSRDVSPDVVVMDIAMPDLNGIEATRQIRRECPDTEVVILSMYGTSEYVFRALEAGAKGYVLKRAAGRELEAAVRSAHTGRRFLSRRATELLVDGVLRQKKALSGESPLEKLSEREREVLQLLVEGKSGAEIARTLFLAESTVQTYRGRIMEKLEIHDLPGLVRFAILHGLTPLE